MPGARILLLAMMPISLLALGSYAAAQEAPLFPFAPVGEGSPQANTERAGREPEERAREPEEEEPRSPFEAKSRRIAMRSLPR